VAVTDVRREPAEEVVAAIGAEGHSAHAWELDVADAQSIDTVMQSIKARFGRLDILVNNAGIVRMLPIEDPGYDDAWHQQMAVLLTGQQRLIRAALPMLRDAAHPRIINIASTEGLGGTALNSAYSAAKAGVIGLTRALAVELGPSQITVNCICPGPIETGMTASIPPQDRAIFAKRRTALRRYGMPVEVAHMTLSLALPAASYVTGAIIPVDGGLVARNA
jgi:3-oxoacyl-[acyl-carrier protein] reductase